MLNLWCSHSGGPIPKALGNLSSCSLLSTQRIIPKGLYLWNAPSIKLVPEQFHKCTVEELCWATVIGFNLVNSYHTKSSMCGIVLLIHSSNVKSNFKIIDILLCQLIDPKCAYKHPIISSSELVELCHWFIMYMGLRGNVGALGQMSSNPGLSKGFPAEL